MASVRRAVLPRESKTTTRDKRTLPWHREWSSENPPHYISEHRASFSEFVPSSRAGFARP